MTDKKIGIYPGTFDPLTLGHLNIIERASRLFDKLIVLVAVNTSKKTLFTDSERMSLIEENVKPLNNVEVAILKDGLVADYYKEVGATALVRGLRNSTDFDYEFSIASGNARQGEHIETVILYAADELRFMSSSLIKEIAFFNGDISKMVPANVETSMKEKYSSN